jgi:hypothetical protein
MSQFFAKPTPINFSINFIFLYYPAPGLNGEILQRLSSASGDEDEAFIIPLFVRFP